MEKMNRENARGIKFYGKTLADCVNDLLEFQKRGESVFIEFNGYKLYSCDVTMDSAYLEVLGMTKAEFDEWKAKRLAEDCIPIWIQEGEPFISPYKREAWKKHVESKARGKFLGEGLNQEIDLMERLKKGESFESLTKMIQEDETRIYRRALKGVLRFSEMGPEFVEYVEKTIGEYTPGKADIIDRIRKQNVDLEALHNPKSLQEQKAVAIEVQFSWRFGSTIEAAVQELLEYKARGRNVYIDFNGHKLYSCDVTMDSAFLEVLGKTKAEVDKMVEEDRKREERIGAEAEANIPIWIEKGKTFIYPERTEEWEKCVRSRAGDIIYHGKDLDVALELMEKLETGATLDEVKEIFDRQGYSGDFAVMIKRILFHFAKRGPEFFESTEWEKLSVEEKKTIENKKKENAQLEVAHREGSPTEVSAGRGAEEAELISKAKEKAQLTQEIGNIEKELEEKNAELRTLAGNKSNPNTIEEQ